MLTITNLSPERLSFPTRRSSDLVLQGADGVVFVGDSQARQLDENLESLQNLQSNLLEHGVDVRTVPLVMRSEEHTSELQSHSEVVCRLLLEKKYDATPFNQILKQ